MNDASLSAAYPFSGRRFELDGLRLHYLDEGPAQAKRAVVMLHGNPTWSYYYRHLIQALRQHHRVVAPDHIGCGRSDKPRDTHYSYTLARRVEDVARLIDHLGLERVTLVVHDWGGMIGLAWATRHVERVERLIVMNTAAFPLPAAKSLPVPLRLARIPALGALLVRGLGAFSRGANRYCATRRRLPREVARAYLAPYDSWTTRIAVHRFIEDIPLTPSDPSYALVCETAERLEQLRERPMLICWGLRDFVFDETFLAEWERRFPGATVARYPDAGHYVLEDAGPEIIAATLRFLEVTSGKP